MQPNARGEILSSFVVSRFDGNHAFESSPLKDLQVELEENHFDYLPPMPGKILPTTFLHLGVLAASSASGSRGGARRPSIATARWRAHSRRLLASAGGTGGGRGDAPVAERCCADDRSTICWLLLSMLDDAGAEVIRRAMRAPSEAGGWDGVWCGWLSWLVASSVLLETVA